MTARRLIAGALGLFVLSSIAFSFWKGSNRHESGQADPGAASSAQDGVIVYYLHATFRCVTCNQIEAMTRRLVDTEFAEDLRAGRLLWREVNFEIEEELARRYDVASSCVVVVQKAHGQESHARLDKVWTLVDSPEEFNPYVRTAVRSALEGRLGEASSKDERMPFWLAVLTALWLGILTSVSPCPLATNIAAVSFIGKRVDNKRLVFLSGGLYTLGRMCAYLALAVIVMAGLMASGEIGRLIDKYLNQVLGPVLILVGMLLLGLLAFSASLGVGGARLQERASKGGIVWAFILGLVFALSFCPVSAGLFFGGLIPLGVSQESHFVLPAFYSVGTALPVIGFAFLVAFASNYVGRAFNRLTQIERWFRLAAGGVFLAAGIYLSLTHNYGMSLLT